MPAEAIETVKPIAAASGSKLSFLNEPHEAVKGAHVIYTDTWTSWARKRKLLNVNCLSHIRSMTNW
jgi:ornithine carbamoyltransferase